MERRLAVFGLTGGIASGKSTVAAYYRSVGLTVIDADQLARLAVVPGSEGLAKVTARFGSSILTDDGALDRGRLAALVFSDEAARSDLNAIVHPIVARLREEQLDRCNQAGQAIACYEAPLLFETGLHRTFENVVLVVAEPAVQVQRACARDGQTPEQVRRRIAAQMPIEQKQRLATHVIDNNGSVEETTRQAASVLADICRRHRIDDAQYARRQPSKAGEGGNPLASR